jgi:AraC-like DNA-binding protein
MQVSLFLFEGLYAHLSNEGLQEAFLNEAGVPRDLFQGVRGRLDLPSMLRAGIAAYRMSGDPALGLHAGESAPLRTLGVLGCLLMHCTTLRQALEALERYLPLLSDRGSFSLRDEGDTMRLCLNIPLHDAASRRFVVEYAVTLMLRIAREFLGREATLDELKLPYEEPAYTAEYARIFACPLRFGASQAELVFATNLLDRRRGFSDDRLWRMLKEEAEAAMEAEASGVPVHRRVYNLLKTDPSLWDAGPRALGKLLGMSPRRLRRSLLSEGKNISGLIEEARLDRARYLLAETDIAIKNIAERLGYSEPSAFHRAFKRWTGQTPGRYKRDHRGALSLAS